MLLTIVTFFIILGLIVLVHELGHFITARRFGIKVDEFGLGLPPRAIGFYRDENGSWQSVGPKTKQTNKTIWSLNWIPLGGFVKIKGEEGQAATDPDSFANKSIGQRAIVLSAGVSMNIVLSALLLTIGLMVGLPQILDDRDLPQTAQVRNIEVLVAEVLPNTPAAAGLQVGDRIRAIDGQALTSIEAIQSYVDQHLAEEVTFEVARDGQTVTAVLTPQILPETERGGVGVALMRTGLVSYPWYTAWWYGIRQTVELAIAIVVGFFIIIKQLVVSQELVGEVYGPVGIATLVGNAVDLGFLYVLQFTAALSVIIAVINYLPFPALDGGRVFFLVIEAIRKKPVNQRLETLLHNVGFALLMVLVLIVTYRDIARISGGFLDQLVSFF